MKSILVIVTGLFLSISSQAQRSYDIQINSTQPSILIASAGDEPTISGTDLVLGDFPSSIGGTEPYTYLWQPEDNLSDPTNANPIFSGNSSITYTLLVTDNRGCSALDTIQILITGLDNLSKENQGLKAFPNPGSGKIRIIAPSNFNLKVTSIQVFDAKGSIVYSGNWSDSNSEYLLDVSKLAKGQYTLLMNDGKLKVTNKMIIQ